MVQEQSANASICLLPALHKRWLKLLGEDGMIYLYAMTGYGKTAQAFAFAQANYKEYLYISAADEDFLKILHNVPSLRGKPRGKTLLILDDLQWIYEENKKQDVFEQLLQLRRARGMQIMLLSRAALPAYLLPLHVTRQLAVETQEVLCLSRSDVKAMIDEAPLFSSFSEQKKEKLAQFIHENSTGFPLGVNVLLRKTQEQPDDLQTALTLSMREVYDYLDVHLLGEWTLSRCDAAMRLSVYDTFSRGMAERLLGSRTDDILRDFTSIGSFLVFKAPDTYYFVPFFREYLQYKLKNRPHDEWQSIYETAAECCEQCRKYEQALQCWRQAERKDKIADDVIYLSENADGCEFARVAQEYIRDLSPDWEQRDPRILACKVMLAAYRMRPQECTAYMERLKEMADVERRCAMRGSAQSVYVRTLISCPYNTAENLKDSLLHFVDYICQTGECFQHIMPTGNMPSLINGGLDLLPWEKNKTLLYPVIKAAAEKIMGQEAVGIADAAMGEILYEQNQRTKAMACLTKALSAINCGGSIRVQYAVTAIMSRLFRSEGQEDTARDILQNVRRIAESEYYGEMLPNINTSLCECALLIHDMVACEDWLRTAPDEYAPFYITMRYQLLMKARVYTAMGKTMEALFILNLLENYADMYKRTYFKIDVLVLKAIILFGREEPWQEVLQEALDIAAPYHLVRIFADQGAALLPLWKMMPNMDAGDPFLSDITKEVKRMAARYPNYLKSPRQFGALSRKEHDVLVLMADGCNNTQISEMLDINLGTAKFHVGNIMKKLNAENRTVAVRIAQEEGLL